MGIDGLSWELTPDNENSVISSRQMTVLPNGSAKRTKQDRVFPEYVENPANQRIKEEQLRGMKVRRPVSRVLSTLFQAMGDHSSGGPLARTRLATNPDSLEVAAPRPMETHGRGVPIRFCSGRGLPCLSRCRSSGALLPHPFSLTPSTLEAVYFLWRFPLDRSSRALPGTLPPWSPDFPHPEGCGRPAV